MKFLTSSAVLFFALTSFSTTTHALRFAPDFLNPFNPKPTSTTTSAPPAQTTRPPLPASTLAPNDYDVIILGGTPAGITAAISASRILADANKAAKILIIERSSHIGGNTANGLGTSIVNTKGATGGLFLEFVRGVKAYYEEKYGKDSKQVKDCQDGYRHEPHVAEWVLNKMLKGEQEGRIQIKMLKQFDAKEENLEFDAKEGRLRSITVVPTIYTNGTTLMLNSTVTATNTTAAGTNSTISATNSTTNSTTLREKYNGKYFIDASYEGDLLAAAKIPFWVGREGEEVYRKEVGAGKVYKYWGGKEAEGTTKKGDDGIQAYNYRLCLTQNATNSVPFTKPTNYNRTEYASIIKDIVNNCITKEVGKENCALPGMPNNTDWKTKMPENRKNWLNGLEWIVTLGGLPNEKRDANNQHMVFLSTDLPQENWKYPTSDWSFRDKYATRLREYTQGLLYFAQHDEELPTWFRESVKSWGYAKDEYTDNNHFPRQMYVREARRMKGKYIFTTHDALKDPYKWDTITSAHFNIDSHAAHKREPNRAHLDGHLSYHVNKPYTVPLRIMIPTNRTDNNTIKNLLVPVAASASHMGHATLRMEPTWMAMGQAAGTLFGLFLKDNSTGNGSTTHVDVWRLQNALLDKNAILYYTRDLVKKHSRNPASIKKYQQNQISKLRKNRESRLAELRKWVQGKQHTLGQNLDKAAQARKFAEEALRKKYEEEKKKFQAEKEKLDNERRKKEEEIKKLFES